MNIRTELLEALVRQCVREVLDQVDEKVGPYGKSSKFPPGPKRVKVKEEQDEKDPNKKPEDNEPQQAKPQQQPQQAQPQPQPNQPEQPQQPPKEPSPEPSDKPSGGPIGGGGPSIEKPEGPEAKPTSLKGAIIVNPKDKSKLDSATLKGIKGQSDANIERILHQIAVRFAGARTKVSLGAKRLAREVSKNDSVIVYFYFGKLDPDSEEIFLMADKSLQIAKDASVQPGDITGSPASTLPSNYKIGGMNDAEYMRYLGSRNAPTPRYGIDENAKKMIKSMINQILDGKKR